MVRAPPGDRLQKTFSCGLFWRPCPMVSLSHLRSVIFKLFWSLPPAAEGRASGGKKRHEEKAWNASRRRWSRCTLGPLAAGLEAEEG